MFDRLITLCLSGAAPALPADWWLQWSLAPAPLVAIAALAWWARGGSPAPRRLAWAGCALCALAWVSPLCRLGATLAVGHMVQLMTVIAAGALLAAGLVARTAPARPAPPVMATTLLHAAVLWLWHLPAAYAAILTDPLLHAGAWALLLGSSGAFWRAVLAAPPQRQLAALGAVLATMAHTGLLGAVLTFAGRPLYALQAPGALAWGLDPLADQQLAGLAMWVPGGLAYLAAAMALGLRAVRPQPAAAA